MHADPYLVQRVSVLLPNAWWREGNAGILSQFSGTIVLTSALYCCYWKADPAQPDGSLSAVKEILWKA